MNIFIGEDTLTIEEVLDFIKDMNISEDKNIMYDMCDGPSIITSFQKHEDMITFTSEYKNTNPEDSLTVSDFLKYVEGMDLNTLIAYFETDYTTLDTYSSTEKECALIGVVSGYKEENSGNLVFSN